MNGKGMIMQDEVIIDRTSYTEDDIDFNKEHYIGYEVYDVTPKNTDFKYGKDGSIVLRNKKTKQLERIKYEFCGSVPFDDEPGCYWYWGHIKAEGYNCYLVFGFNADGSLKSISASFAAKNPSSEEFHKMNEGIEYPAQITSRGAF